MSTATGPADRLDTLPSGAPEFTLGHWAIWWAEEHLIQPNGPRAGQAFRFTPRQKRFLLWWYAVDPDGRWLFHRAVRRLAKGSGKSPFAAVLALIEFCAPVRLAHLDIDKADPRLCEWGWTVGKPVDLPLVQIAATAESQTSNTMRMVRAFAPKRSKVVEAHGLDPGKTKYYKLPEGTLEVITSSFTAAEGAEASFVVADETEHWKPANGGVELASTLIDNLAKSGSRMLETANAWIPGQDSVAEDSYADWIAQEEGRTRGDTKVLYDAVIAPPDTDLADPASLRAALELVYEDCWWQDVTPIMERIWAPSAKPADSKRKYLNWPAAATDAWIEPQEWDRLALPGLVVADGDEIVLFFDGSKSRDATALIACRVEDGHVFVPGDEHDGIWEPDRRNDPTVTVDADDVDRVVRQTFDRYDVAAFFADVREWESWTLSTWPNEYGEQLRMWAVPSGKPPQAIAWDMRSHKDEFAKAAEACHDEIVEGAFTHDGDSRLARHVHNMRRRPYKDMVSVGKESPDSPNKIDAGICVIGVRMVRRMYLGSGGRKREKKAGSLW